MRFAYAGTHCFGALVLVELLQREARPEVVITRPDKPRGRHGHPQPTAVKEVAQRHGLEVLQPGRMGCGLVAEVHARGAEALVVCAHGEIVREPVLEALLTVVVHPSPVPRWRGAAPVERALMAGETRLGVTTLRMTAGVDEGPVGDLRWVDVPREADAGCAYELLAGPACDSLLATLAAVEDGSICWREQQGQPSYAAKISKEDRVLDLEQPAQTVVDTVRALAPWVGARLTIAGRELTVWRARACAEPSEEGPGERLLLPAADGWVEVLELQAPGGRRMTTAEYLRGAGRWLTSR
jgi:methionyl-tRNA formyltransferase